MTYTQELADALTAMETFASVPSNADTSMRLMGWSHDKGDEMPFTIITKPVDMGNPTVRKFFRRVEFFGKGTIYGKFYVDNKLVATGHAAMTPTPRGDRFVNLPRGSKGYRINMMLVLIGRLDGYKVHVDAIGEPAKKES